MRLRHLRAWRFVTVAVVATSACVKGSDGGAVTANAPADVAGLRPGGDPEPAAGLTPAAGDVELGASDADVIPAAAVGVLPENWQGTGVLSERRDRVPRQAPAWARIAAEVVSRDGQRYLVATGRAGKIRDPFLSRTTAESRARSTLAQWLGAARLDNSVISDVWRDPKTGETFARAEVPVAIDWQPAKPL